MKSNNSEFWTDELAKEFAVWCITEHRGGNALDQFKELKSQQKKDWEILSFSSSKFPNIPQWILKNGTYCNNLGSCLTLDEMLSDSKGHTVKTGEIQIHSVKRLSDEEVFTVGDEIYQGKILCFEIHDNRIFIQVKGGYGFSLNQWCKKQPLFKSEDGFDIFERDTIFPVTDDFQLLKTDFASKKDIGIRAFKFRENASKYIYENKKQFSLKDIKNAWRGYFFVKPHTIENIYSYFLENLGRK